MKASTFPLKNVHIWPVPTVSWQSSEFFVGGKLILCAKELKTIILDYQGGINQQLNKQQEANIFHQLEVEIWKQINASMSQH